MASDSNLDSTSDPLTGRNPVHRAGANQRPKTIALVIHALYGGGAERLMSQLANRWAEAGHRVHLITLSHTSTDSYRVQSSVQRLGLDLMANSRGPLSALLANKTRVQQLRKQLRKLAPDCILSFCDRMNITTVTAALPLDKPLWIAEHSDPSRQKLGLLWETWRRWAYHRLATSSKSGCVVLTQEIASTMRRRFPALKLEVIPPAIHLYDCSNTMTQRSSDLRLLSIGRHSPEKNLSSLLEAWQKIEQQFPSWRLVMAGDGPEHARLKALAERLQISGRVDFLGWVKDPEPLYRESELIAITSHYEGVPVAMLEAMSAGLACVSTPCTRAVHELAAKGGLVLSQSTDSKHIAQALSAVMRDPNQRRQLAETGRTLVRPYSWEIIGPKWDELMLNNDR